MALMLLVAVALSLGGPQEVPQEVPREVDPIADFNAQVEAYAVLRREVAAAARPRLEPTNDPQTICDACDALAAGLVRARPNARLGDLFTPSVVADFKQRVRTVATPEARRAWYHDLYSEGQKPPRRRLSVHSRMRDDEFSPVMPVALLHVLPALPPELAYRLAGQDLLLVDPDAGLVIDLLPEALPGPLRP